MEKDTTKIRNKKRNTAIGCFSIIVILFFIGSCVSVDNDTSNKQEVKETVATKVKESNEKEKLNVTLDYSIEKTPNDEYKITVITNLPENCKVNISLDNFDRCIKELNLPSDSDSWSNDQWDKFKKISYNEVKFLNVQNGKFEAIFPKNNFRSGDFTLRIGSIVGMNQPNEVKKIIGEKGEFLSGEYVQTSEASSNVGNIISIDKKINL
jgi:hypothetical protein